MNTDSTHTPKGRTIFRTLSVIALLVFVGFVASIDEGPTVREFLIILAISLWAFFSEKAEGKT